ncbi:MAG: GTP cyclohydrolase I FolE [Candidatus Peregrinibacteria bacterium]
MIDTEKLKKACTLILEAIGENPEREGLQDTPRRFAEGWKELCSGYEGDDKTLATAFDGESYDEMVVVKDIEFQSLCEHHLLPILGKVSVGYIPDKKIIGLSKIPRIVERVARRLQNQERMTMQIADTLIKLLDPKGVAVKVSASHLCMQMRGVKKTTAKMDTSAVRGLFRNDPKTREEFFRMIG